MGSLKSKPKHFQDGQRNLHPDDLNSMVDIGIRSITGPGTRNFGDRITIDTFQGVFGKEVKLFPFKVVKEEANHLVCVPYIPDGFPSVVGNEVYEDFDPEQHVFVAKPFLLQQQPFNARTILYGNGNTEGYVYDPDVVYDRTVNGSNSWTDHVEETISPGYYVGDHIWAIYGVTNLYEVSTADFASGAITGSSQILVTQDFWESVEVGSRIRIEITTIDSTGTSDTKAYIGADVLGKTQLSGNYYLLLEVRDENGIVVTLTGTNISVALETPIVWEDANTGARKWTKKENYPEGTFLRLLEKTPSKNKYYLSEMKVSRATSSGDVSWVNPPVPEKRYVYAELVNNAPPNDDTATIYYGVLSKGPVRTIGHPSYGSLPLYDAFEAGIPARPRFIEYTSQTKDEKYRELYPALYYTRNVDESGSVEWLPTACLATMANKKIPTLEHLYMALHVDNNVTLGVLKAGKKRVYHTEGTCCDEDFPDPYYGSGVDDGDRCRPGFCWDPDLQECYCCAGPLDCCSECWSNEEQACVPCDPPPAQFRCDGPGSQLMPGQLYVDFEIVPALPWLPFNAFTAQPMPYDPLKYPFEGYAITIIADTSTEFQSVSLGINLCQYTGTPKPAGPPVDPTGPALYNLPLAGDVGGIFEGDPHGAYLVVFNNAGYNQRVTAWTFDTSGGIDVPAVFDASFHLEPVFGAGEMRVRIYS